MFVARGIWVLSTKVDMVCLSPVGYGFDQQRLIWYVCRLWDVGLINKG